MLAYTYPSTSQMVNCPLFFSGLTALSRTCHAQDQATTVLHEMTHLSQVKGTTDYGGYGYNFVRSLTAAQNLNHADTYTLFAQGKSRLETSGRYVLTRCSSLRRMLDVCFCETLRLRKLVRWIMWCSHKVCHEMNDYEQARCITLTTAPKSLSDVPKPSYPSTSPHTHTP